MNIKYVAEIIELFQNLSSINVNFSENVFIW